MWAMRRANASPSLGQRTAVVVAVVEIRVLPDGQGLRLGESDLLGRAGRHHTAMTAQRWTRSGQRDGPLKGTCTAHGTAQQQHAR